MNDLHAAIEEVAKEAGDIALGHFGKLSDVPIESKGHLDLVTVADKEVERLISTRLGRLFPDDGIFGEEGSFAESRSGRVWVIDPIDGTFNFVRGSSDWAVSIGLVENGKPSFGVLNLPARREILSGGRDLPAMINQIPLPRPRAFDRSRAAVGVGIHPNVHDVEGTKIMKYIIEDARMAFRCSGSTAISLVDVAEGHVDGYIGIGIPTWDLLGILPALEQLGVTSTIDWARTDLSATLRFACGTAGFLEVVAGRAVLAGQAMWTN